MPFDDVMLRASAGSGISEARQRDAIVGVVLRRPHKRVLIIPPDITRLNSGAGFLTCCCYEALKTESEVDIMPALGTHAPMSDEELNRMYPGIPHDRFLVHNWRTDVERLGTVPGEYLARLSGGAWSEPVDVELDRRVLHGGYDLVLSVGQVVPHEVAGMSGYTKNLFVGAGGSDMINKSHMLGAVCGLESIMGRDNTPVRGLFDYAYDNFMGGARVLFALTVMTAPMGKPVMHGLFIGESRGVFEAAVSSAAEHNIFMLERGIKKAVVFLDPSEFRSTWLGNKAVYRTRMAIEDGGELLVLAPGVRRFGEDSAVDGLIRKYGYRGRPHTLKVLGENADLRENMSAAAHLIHGSSEGRFKITYAAGKLTEKEIRSVGYEWADCESCRARYDPEKLAPGVNIMQDGEEIYYIPNPALGLWIDGTRFKVDLLRKDDEK